MPHLTVPQTIQWTGFLWLLLCAVWLGSSPFVKPAIHKQSASSAWQRSALLIAGMYLIFGPLRISDWLNQQILAVTLPIALTGFFFVLCGVAFSIWARLILGENWSAAPSIKQDHALIQRGPYRIVRHPIYTGILIALFGSALQRGLIGNFLGVIICAVALWMKIAVEEKFMLSLFGDQYLHYRNSVRALIPFIF
jgi:protein-S-isoprenylcysteine O-methyltransferase Ste14